MILEISKWNCKQNNRFVLQIWYWRSTTGTARRTRGLFYRYDTEDQEQQLQGEQEVCFTDMTLKINNRNYKENKRIVLQIWHWRSTAGTARITRGLFCRYATEDQQQKLQREQEICFTDMILKINNRNCQEKKRFVLQIWY